MQLDNASFVCIPVLHLSHHTNCDIYPSIKSNKLQISPLINRRDLKKGLPVQLGASAYLGVQTAAAPG